MAYENSHCSTLLGSGPDSMVAIDNHTVASDLNRGKTGHSRTNQRPLKLQSGANEVAASRFEPQGINAMLKLPW
jgi:hypothetical protein